LPADQVDEAADEVMASLRTQLGRPPTLDEVQHAMMKISTLVFARLQEEEAQMNLETAAQVEGDDVDERD
jgi:hypothetical protein